MKIIGKDKNIVVACIKDMNPNGTKIFDSNRSEYFIIRKTTKFEVHSDKSNPEHEGYKIFVHREKKNEPRYQLATWISKKYIVEYYNKHLRK